MNIAGFQKLSLVDYPEKSCATIFTPSCTFRCPFCHNSNIAFALQANNNDFIDEKEVFEYLKKRKALLDGVCISGGEPTLQKDLIDFIKKVKDLGYSVKLDTNGNSPDVLKDVIASSFVDYIAMDLKNSFDSYSKAVGLSDFDTLNVEKSVEMLLSSNINYEFRTTLVAQIHDDQSIKDMAYTIKNARLWRLQKFQQSDAVPDITLKAIESDEIINIFEKIEIKPNNIIYY